MIEYGWLDAMRTVELYAYRFAAADFVPVGEHQHAYVRIDVTHPIGPPERVGDLFALHDEAGIELRVVRNLWPWWHAVIESSLEFSGIRLRNARPSESVSASR